MMTMIRRTISIFLPVCLLPCIFLLLTGCAEKSPLNPNHPVSLTLWHNYGGIMQTAMDQLVEEFNDTAGKESGIIINVESVNSSSVLQKKLLAAADGDLGADGMPDITTCYPQIAVILAGKNLLADLGKYFTEKELSAYVSPFIQEGRIGDALYVFPIAKSTEVLFVNQTIFDRFAHETGASMDDLSTFEGLLSTAKTYYQWSGGKSFYMADSLFNLMQVGMEQLGDSFIKNEALNTSSRTYQHIRDLFHAAASAGYIAVYEGYSSDLQKTGDILASTGSTAGILYYGYSVTYADNTSEAVEYRILPFPVFAGGERVAIQRGNGMVVIASTSQKEYAAVHFLKWFTEKGHNMQFISQTGYLPVTNSAFEALMTGKYQMPKDENIRKLLNTAMEMYREYRFYTPPVFERFDALGKEWESLFYASVTER